MRFQRIGVGLVVGLVAVGMSAVAAAGTGQIRGTGALDLDGSCDDMSSPFAPIEIEGDLVGCVYATSFEVVQETPSGVYQERGTETFVGCLADGTTCGTLNMTYKFTGKFASDGSPIHGRCQHPTTSGTGDFAGATGRIDFKDDTATGVLYYRGHIKLPTDTATSSKTASTASGDSGGTC
jgi:hypothetical protein